MTYGITVVDEILSTSERSCGGKEAVVVLNDISNVHDTAILECSQRNERQYVGWIRCEDLLRAMKCLHGDTHDDGSLKSRHKIRRDKQLDVVQLLRFVSDSAARGWRPGSHPSTMSPALPHVNHNSYNRSHVWRSLDV